MKKINYIFLCLFLFSQFLYSSEKLKKVTIQLSWFDQFQFAGYYLAKEKGFYKDLGLDVDIKSFQFGIDIPKSVNDGVFDFAVGRETLILDKAKGNNIVALYATFQSSPLILLSTKESGINSISDFENKRIMTTIDDAGEVSLKSMISSHKIDFNKLDFLKHTHNINDLVNKNTDIISAYISKTTYDLNKMGIDYNIFAPKDYGFDMYSDLLYTSENLINKDLDTVIKFKKASLKGWNYAYNNIEESVNLIFDTYNTQNISKEALSYEAKELKKLSYLHGKELGDISLSKLQRIHDLYNVMGLLPKKININDFFYNENNLYNKFTYEEKKFIKDNPLITVGEIEGFKPINFLNDIGLHDGIVHDYFKIIAEKSGLRFIPDIDTKENLINKLSNKEVDLLAISLDLNSDTTLNTTPYFRLNETSFILKSKSVNNIKRIGVIDYISNSSRNTNILNAYPNSKILNFDNINDAEEDLRNENVDILYVPEEIMLTHIKDKHINYIEYAQTKIKAISTPINISLNANSLLLKNILSKSIKDISFEQHESIRNKWIPLMFENKLDWNLIAQIVMFIVIVIVMLIYKQISMHKINDKLNIKHKELEKANDKLKELSELDHLTMLYNRRYFENITDDILLLERRENNSTSLLVLDVDNFKKINDVHGHKIGDKVLQKLAKKVKELSRKSDIVARIGGEEFIILLPNTNLEGAQIHCENIRKSIENLQLDIDGKVIAFTVSMGLTSFRKDEILDDAFVRADNSLYEAKRTGRNRLLVN